MGSQCAANARGLANEVQMLAYPNSPVLAVFLFIPYLALPSLRQSHFLQVFLGAPTLQASSPAASLKLTFTLQSPLVRGSTTKKGGENPRPNDPQLPQLGTHGNRKERPRLGIRSYKDFVAQRSEREKTEREERRLAEDMERRRLDHLANETHQRYLESRKKNKEKQLAKNAQVEENKARRAAKKAERDAKKAERDAKKAERDAKKAVREAKKAKAAKGAKEAEQEVPGPSRPEFAGGAGPSVMKPWKSMNKFTPE
ncbi:hypothetical protein F5148DRAFT_1369824 [Russula earlei]|uniref:Uncharacterized protein n=1 Tax=Russula earlei TaxID=71964 RepID=A0ACC0U101_9AGAM|nr:hypothetical protein F5148DRAFT_1369824 [Russula earlei]